MAFTPDGRRLATPRSEDGSAKDNWDVTPEGGRDLLTLVAHAGAVDGVAYAPDGATPPERAGRVDGKTKIWCSHRRTSATRTSERSIPGPRTPQPACGSKRLRGRDHRRRQPRCRRGPRTGTVRLQDAASGRVLATLATAHQGVQSLAFDGDGKRLAIGNFDGTAVVWDTHSGRQRHTSRPTTASSKASPSARTETSSPRRERTRRRSCGIFVPGRRC